MASATAPADSPPRTDAIPDSYGILVTEDAIHVWQFRITVAQPNGRWTFVESIDRGDGLRLHLDYALPEQPQSERYWIYSKHYDCELGCSEAGQNGSLDTEP